MKIFMVAGERSGDLHAGNLIDAILSKNPEIEIKCWGGDRMQRAGAEVSMHYRNLAFMGIWEVVKNLMRIRKLFKQCIKDIENFKPDLLLLVDYPGFNMRLARYFYQRFPVYYYIAPKAWAWNKKRAHGLRKYVNEVLSILPFEIDFFKSYGVPITYVGNPLLDEIKNYVFDDRFINQYKGKKIIAVLPGSRNQEISHMAMMLTQIHQGFPNYQFLVAGVDNVPSSLYEPITHLKNAEIAYDKTYEILKLAEAALVTSGTATLEAALFKVPQVVCYKTSSMTYWIARMMIEIDYISLVNLIPNKEVVKELIQQDFNPKSVNSNLQKLLNDAEVRLSIATGYQEIELLLTNKSASKEAAEILLKKGSKQL